MSFRRPTATHAEQLPSGEAFWRDQGGWLEKQGYKLRPRYSKEWKASWLDERAGKINPKKPISQYEDGLPLTNNSICDATRVSDQIQVCLKVVRKAEHPFEAEIRTYISSALLSQDTTNHCVPTLKVLEPPENSNLVIIVMPLLRGWASPPFAKVGEMLEFVGQLIEGMEFMHKLNIAHRGISTVDVMMDGSMYPEGWHPREEDMDRTMTKKAKSKTRSERPPKYYFVGFGISGRYDPGHDRVLVERASMGSDKTVPEFSALGVEYDPFAADVYLLGNLFKEGILKEYEGTEFLKPLVDDMVKEIPRQRLTISEVALRYTEIRKEMKKKEKKSVRLIHSK